MILQLTPYFNFYLSLIFSHSVLPLRARSSKSLELCLECCSVGYEVGVLLELLAVCGLASHRRVTENVVAKGETAKVSDSDLVAGKELRLVCCQLRLKCLEEVDPLPLKNLSVNLRLLCFATHEGLEEGSAIG